MGYYGYQTYPSYQGNPYANNMYNGLPQSTIQQLNANQMQAIQGNQQPIQQQVPVEQNLQYVDSIDVVKSTNARLDGQSVFFPKTDGSEIYCKKLNPQTGAGIIMTYRLVDDNQTVQSDMEVNQITTMISSLKNDIGELKELFLDKATEPRIGGAKR